MLVIISAGNEPRGHVLEVASHCWHVHLAAVTRVNSPSFWGKFHVTLLVEGLLPKLNI